MKHILIIGCAGYIGSYLMNLLSKTHDVKGCDIRESEFTTFHKEGRNLTVEELSTFDIIIYLAGFSGRNMCLGYDFSRSYEENVVDIRTVAQKLTSTQILLYASSASIVEGHEHPVQENCTIHETLLDKYAQSMYIREKEINQLSIRSIGIRFGTVIGISPKQRTDLVHLAMIRKALQTGTISVQYPNCRRGILGLDDLGKCFYKMIEQIDSVQQSSIYHLCSFNTSIDEIAKEVSIQTNSSLVYDTCEEKSNDGFHLNCDSFETRFGKHCTASKESLISQLIEHFSKAHTPCRVCGKDTTVVLDLGKQPLANNNVDEPCEQPTFPLVLTRCKDCHHTQQDYTVPPDEMFSSYQYMSGTSKTLCNYFSWLADSISKTISEIDTRQRVVLELACNDGSQLDEFKKRGWKTIGVDPAKNIGEIASKKGHEIHVKFWGTEQVDIDTPDAIVAQNVCAHVPCPVPFLKACHDVMGSHSYLYIQTSQCNMYQYGEFDTIYHEHLSFFTADSMKRAASLSGLAIVHVEKTPIHGTSYLFTMKRMDSDSITIDSTMEELITFETPYYQDSFFTKYKQRIYCIQKWVNKMTVEFTEKGYTVVAFGAAAKGMTLLNFFNINKHITYIVDDAYMKQGKYTPNSNILIRNPSVLQDDNRPLVIIVLAWNFIEEISTKISEWRKGKETILIVPYPQQSVRYLF
jgi:nucleoside-diphosphate-sugar epimerase